jgi:hypothetical protein
MLNIAIGAILIAGGVTILDWIADIAITDMNVNAQIIQEFRYVELNECLNLEEKI